MRTKIPTGGKGTEKTARYRVNRANALIEAGCRRSVNLGGGTSWPAEVSGFETLLISARAMAVIDDMAIPTITVVWFRVESGGSSPMTEARHIPTSKMVGVP